MTFILGIKQADGRYKAPANGTASTLDVYKNFIITLNMVN